MPIFFSNPGEIDLDAALTLGVNAKLSSNAIGQFGTGLKYAIAVLLRTGHEITITTSDNDGICTNYKFSTMQRTSRNTSYDVVCCNLRPLGFTTALGKNWKVWQAFRELYSNCLDENGLVEEKVQLSELAPNTTCIIASGEEISKVWRTRHRYFLENAKPSTVYSNVEIYPGKNIFYKGILVQECESVFAYNLTSDVELTEDRTIGNLWSVHWDISRAIQSQQNSKYLGNILANPACIEHDFPWGTEFSTVNEKILRSKNDQETLPPKFRGIAQSLQVRSGILHYRTISARETQMLTKAKKELIHLGFEITQNVYICDLLPHNLMGLAQDAKIYLAGELFTQGQTKITGTLLEEHLHIKYGFTDMTRAFQNYLIDVIAEAAGQMAKRIGEDPPVL